jgi:predicted enzyme related to lactoylglutathione lyase
MTMSKFVWFEYVAKDIHKAQGFFGELFNWGVKQVPMPGGDYAMISVGDRTIGGYLVPPEGAPQHAHWLSHLQTTDARATSKQVEALGGKVLKPAFQVGDFGTMAIAADPNGGYFALWQPAKAEPDPAPADHTFCWNELASVAPDKSVEFYAKVGGFTDKPMEMGPMGTYHVLEAGGVPRAGIMKQMMPEQPHAWLPYVQVANADATAEKAKKLGATIVVPPTDIPNVGRFSVIVDPQGCAIGVLKP